MSSHVLAHRAHAAGGFVVSAGRVIVPPPPRASAIVDPRIGDLGPALLALEDGTVFPGVAFGAAVAAGGDLVVNTSQTGYQEVCTDPSYAGQIVVMTYPLIGNYGRLADDDQSIRPWLRALVVANATAAVLDGARQLAALLRDAGIPAIAGVDTRALARHLRANGCLRGIVTAPGDVDVDAARAAAARGPALGGPGLRRPGVAAGRHRVRDRPATRARGSGSSISGSRTTSSGRCGSAVPGSASSRTRPSPRTSSRRTSTASSSRRGRAIRPGWSSRWRSRARSSTTAGRCSASASVIRSSGGPPAPTRAACASATTGRTTRSATSSWGSSRSPPRTTRSRWSASRCRRASGFRVSQVNLNDGSVEGLRHRDLPIETVQYHPEGAPGPLDALAVFDRFVAAATTGKTRARRDRRRASPPRS